MDKKYVLSYGIHDGTFGGRDNANPQEFDTYEEAYAEYINIFLPPGYQIWFATITAPDGNVMTLEDNCSYKSPFSGNF